MAALPRLLGQETFRKVSTGIGDERGNEIKHVPWQPVTHHWHFAPVFVTLYRLTVPFFHHRFQLLGLG
jgi:hypothetical protein